MASVRPTTGLPPGVYVGATGPRLLAALVEVGPVWLLMVLAVLFAVVLDGRTAVAVVFVLLAVGWGGFVWAQRATRAAGVGMRLDSLQLVGFSDGRPIGWGRVLIRWLVFAALTLTVVGLIALAVAMSRHPRRQGWHDLAANAVVIKERPLAPPRPRSAVSRAAAPASVGASASGSPSVGASSASSVGLVPEAAAVSHSPDSSAPPIEQPDAPDGSGSDDEPASDATNEPASDAADESASGESADHSAYEWLLHLDDGRDVGVDRLVLIGRNPQPRVGEEDATLIKVSDDGRTVSKSHLAVGVDARGLYVMDRGSTNGTTVTAADGGQRSCPPGDLVDVPAGSVVSFGDHWLEVRRPGG